MSLLLKRWRLKVSPAARRGRAEHREYTAWAAKQQALRVGVKTTTEKR